MSQIYIDQVKMRLKNHNMNSKAIVAMILFGAIIMTFIFSDFTGRRSGSLGIGAAAEVNGEIITVKQFQEAEQKMMDYYSKFFGGKMDNEFQRQQIMTQALNELVNRELASQKAEKEKIFATDLEVQKMIVEDLPYFKKDGIFQKDLYKGLLSANRLTPAEFETQIKQDLKSQKVRELFELGLKPGQMIQNIEKELKARKLNVAYLKLNSESLKGSISSNDIKENLAKAEFLKKVEDSYNAKKSSFEAPEQVKASHILVKADMTNSAEVTKAQAKAQELLNRVSKEDFGKLAAQNSDDPGSKAKNGDLGFFTRGKMVPAFEEAAFQLNVGQVSGLVKTDYGFHIIKVTDKKAAKVTSLEEAKNDLAAQVLADEKLNSLTKTIEEHLKSQNVSALQDLVSQNKLKWEETGFFDLSNEELPKVNSAQLFKAALNLNSDQVLTNSLVREGDSQYILKLIDRKVEASEVDGKIQDLVSQQKSMMGYSQWVNEFKKNSKIETNTALLKQ